MGEFTLKDRGSITRRYSHHDAAIRAFSCLCALPGRDCGYLFCLLRSIVEVMANGH